MPDLNKLSATDIAQGIAAEKFTAEAVVRDCLDRIAAREPTVHAWATIDPDHALTQARALDRVPRARRAARRADRRQGHHRHRRPADRDGLADLQGQPLARRRRLRRARARGRRGDPRQDRHRRIRRHVSGPDRQSAQSRAHAGRLVDAARPRRSPTSWCRSPSARRPAARCCGPASYCGVRRLQADLQPDQPRRASSFAAETLDTIGLLDAHRRRRRADHRRARQQAAGVSASSTPPPRLGLCRTPLWDTARDADQARGRGRRQAARGRRRVGEARSCCRRNSRSSITRARETINNYERSKSMAADWQHHPDKISKVLGDRIKKGFAMKHEDYVAALQLAERLPRAHRRGLSTASTRSSRPA